MIRARSDRTPGARCRECHTNVNTCLRQTKKKGYQKGKTWKEPQHPKWRGDMGYKKRDANQGYSVAEQQRKEDIEGEQSAGENDKALLLDSAACHIPRGDCSISEREKE
ncbi:hypothetical protein NDU88_002440 [Pleurodeles waltl]|uniref:Uncharacterized protein n=1 Tax=Pleurodeles waltl TaxID=8319 RepID=A0AAV7MRM9_PLEWA|nr:hypothetical protein NDU88_002440 [Pleurodeles waltl]